MSRDRLGWGLGPFVLISRRRLSDYTMAMLEHDRHQTAAERDGDLRNAFALGCDWGGHLAGNPRQKPAQR